MSVPDQLCTFRLDGHYFGIDVLKVQEVIRFQEMTRVPLAPPVVRGLINLRGHVVTAMDLRTRLGIAPRPDDEQPMNVVVRTEDDDTISFLVDEIGDIIEPEEATFETPPAMLARSVREVVSGVFKLDDGLLLVMDAERAKNYTA